MRSTNDTFRNEIEAILDRILPDFIPPARMMSIAAAEVTEGFDWAELVERLVGPPVNQGAAPRFVRLNPTVRTWS